VLSRLKGRVVETGGWPTPADRDRVFALENAFVPDLYATVLGPERATA
jgi:hypothetical protein